MFFKIAVLRKFHRKSPVLECLFSKNAEKVSNTGVFLWNLWIFKSTFFIEHLQWQLWQFQISNLYQKKYSDKDIFLWFFCKIFKNTFYNKTPPDNFLLLVPVNFEKFFRTFHSTSTLYTLCHQIRCWPLSKHPLPLMRHPPQ